MLRIFAPLTEALEIKASMKQMSHDDLEFLFFVRQELDKVEQTAFGFPDEATMREVTGRLRHLLHEKQSSITKLYDLFEKGFHIYPEKVTYIFTENDVNSPACYKVEFSENLNQESIDEFSGKCVNENRFDFCYPIAGFNRHTSVFDTEKPFSLDGYLNLPIFSIDKTLITRGQLIRYLANKKGIAHFSGTRDKFWQKQIDKVWRHKTSLKEDGEEQTIRSLYEIAQRIVNEILSINGLREIRNNILEIENQVNEF